MNKYIFILLLMINMSFSYQANAQDVQQFDGTFIIAEKSYELLGEASFVEYPSLFSIFINTDKGNCGLHLMGLKKIDDDAEEVIFNIPERNGLNARVVCVFEGEKPKERFVAEEGQIILKNDANTKNLKGNIKAVLTGGITQKIAEVEGAFNAGEMQ